MFRQERVLESLKGCVEGGIRCLATVLFLVLACVAFLGYVTFRATTLCIVFSVELTLVSNGCSRIRSKTRTGHPK